MSEREEHFKHMGVAALLLDFMTPGDMLICFWKCTMFVSGSHVVVNRLSLTVITAGAGPDPQADGVPLHLPGG